MPDSIRLSVLARLREDAGLTLAHVAQRCGLTDSNGRRSVSAWETGKSIPRSRYRWAFALYLLRDLRLAHTPDQFDDIWVILIDEWHWDALDPDERADLWRKAQQADDPWAEVQAIVDGVGTDKGEESEEDPPAATNTKVDKPTTSAVNAPPTDTTPVQRSTPTTATLGWQRTQTTVVAVLAIAVVAVFAFTPQISQQWSIWSFFQAANPTATPTLVISSNFGFETGDLSGWELVGEVECTAVLIDDSALAQDGRYFLALARAGEECVSLRNDMLVELNVGESVAYALWVRATTPQPQTMELVLWGGSYEEDKGETVHVKSAKNAIVDDSGWQCIETSMTLDTRAYDFFRGELYLPDTLEQTIEIDSAWMQAGRTNLCPPLAPRLMGGDFEHADQLVTWQRNGDQCNLVIENSLGDPPQGSAVLNVGNTGPDCTSIYQDWIQPTQPQAEYTAQIWVRSADGLPRQGVLALHVIGAPDTTATSPFIVADEWQCVAATLPADSTNSYTGLRAEIYFDHKVADGSYFLDATKLVQGSDTCPPDALAMPDSGFEQQAAAVVEGKPLPVPIWSAINGCEVAITSDEQRARTGRGLLTAREAPNTDCGSIYADIDTSIPVQVPIHFAFWGRAAGDRPVQGTLVLWVGDGTGHSENSKQAFTLNSSGWRCFETVHTVSSAGFSSLRTEIYLETPDEDGYLFDDLQLSVGETPLCPEMDLALRSTELTHPERTFYPGSTVSVESEIRNLSNSALDPCGNVAIWIAESPDGPPIEATFVRRIPIPALDVNQASPRLVTDVSIPLGIDPQKPYYVVWQIEGDGCTDSNPSNDQESRSIAISACETDRFYCDVPINHWALAEIERWHEDGISTGCRSNTTPFVDRPFCPSEQVRRVTLVIFALRHLLGGGYVPERGFEGRFADLPEDVSHRWALWVEEFYERGYSLSDAACPPSEDKPNFCPDVAVSRADLVLSLAGMLNWELRPVEGTIYRDVTEDTQANRAIEYAARNGLLDSGDPYCVNDGTGARFCPQDPARRAFAALVMVRAFGEEGSETGD